MSARRLRDRSLWRISRVRITECGKDYSTRRSFLARIVVGALLACCIRRRERDKRWHYKAFTLRKQYNFLTIRTVLSAGLGGFCPESGQL